MNSAAVDHLSHAFSATDDASDVNDPMYDVFVVGAGFSRPAGIPLTSELFRLVVCESKAIGAYDILEPDVRRYIEYYDSTHTTPIALDDINIEGFMSYLDIEHYLSLKGSDTWSEEGNRSQILVRHLIAKIIFDRLSSVPPDQQKLYDLFAIHLDPGDIVITFNYDTLIEDALKRNGKPYRLFLDRLISVDGSSGKVDTEAKEVILLKMHGSIDWFDRTYFDNNLRFNQETPCWQLPYHKIFSNQSDFLPEKIVNGPYFSDSPLQRLYKVRNLDRYFEMKNYVSNPPLILSPSFSKIVYLNLLKEFWNSFYSAGPLNRMVAIIGFSLPEHDEYVRLPLFSLIHSFQNIEPNLPNLKKTRLKIVDLRKDGVDLQTYKQRYSFVDWNRADCCFEGFGQNAINMVFEKPTGK